jgi:hypothetical protein
MWLQKKKIERWATTCMKAKGWGTTGEKFGEMGDYRNKDSKMGQ